MHLAHEELKEKTFEYEIYQLSDATRGNFVKINEGL